jgi:hypothetical protein
MFDRLKDLRPVETRYDKKGRRLSRRNRQLLL